MEAGEDFVMAHLSPGWDGVHSLIVHFPIVLLLLAPVFVIMGAVPSAARKRLFLGSALTLMILGTGMTYLAVATGELAMKNAVAPPAFATLLEEHRSLAQSTRELFSVLTLAFAALLFAHGLLRRELDSWVRTSLFAAFLIFYGTGAIFLVETAVKGGHLAHVLGAKTTVTCNLPSKGGR
jgi:uncharacterized membrane protein